MELLGVSDRLFKRVQRIFRVWLDQGLSWQAIRHRGWCPLRQALHSCRSQSYGAKC